jgi:hypothetical protein
VPSTISTAWLLRATSFIAIGAAMGGVIVMPGLRGNAGDVAVLVADRASTFLSFLLAVTLVALVFWGALQLVQSSAPVVVRSALISAGAAAVAISLFAFRERLLGPFTVLLTSAAAIAALAASSFAARGPHTRATAGVLFAFAFASIVRVAAWVAATRAGDSASMSLFGVARNLASTGVLLEAAGQLIAFLWLGTRSRAFGQLGSFLALVGAVVLTRGVAVGVHSGASAWQAVMHTALGDPPGVPPAAWLAALATFLVPASMLLALAVAIQPGQVAIVVATMALALVSRGSFDAPLRALCAVAAAQWAALACVDEKAMWKTLIADRKRRLAEDGVESGDKIADP